MDQWSDSTLKAWFYVLLGAAVLCGVWLNIEPHACPVPKALLTSESAAQPACFEFWLNRYQTIAGAIAAVGAAWYAGYWVRQQISKADEQISIARIQIASDRIPLINERMRAVNETLENMKTILADMKAIKQQADFIERVMIEIDSDISGHVEAARAHPLVNYIANSCSERIDILSGAASKFAYMLDQQATLIRKLQENSNSAFIDYELMGRVIVFLQDASSWMEAASPAYRALQQYLSDLADNGIEFPASSVFRFCNADMMDPADAFRPESMSAVNEEHTRLRFVRDITVRDGDKIFKPTN